jgi:cobalt-zinc-cadmium efflux system protein
MHGLHHHGPLDSEIGHQRSHPVGIKSLGVAIALTGGFAVVELLAGLWSGSLALVSDAGHMATDATALLIALFAQILARRPATPTFSYGFGRIEALAALINGLVLLGLTIWIVVEALDRFSAPHAIQSTTLMLVAAIGLLVNLVVAWALSKDRHDLNTKAALAHVLGDLLGSLAALGSGLALYLGAPNWIDPALSLLICLLIFRSAWAVSRTSFNILMERAPEDIDARRVFDSMSAVPDVHHVHNLHIWELAPGQVALTAHLQVGNLANWPNTMEKLLACLHDQGIDHVTLQPEPLEDVANRI